MATVEQNKVRLERAMIIFIRGRYKALCELDAVPKANQAQIDAYAAVVTWLGTCNVELAAKLDAVDAAPTEEARDAVELDLATLQASDPQLTLRALVKL